jgi:citrate lyase subunit beta/citryl-CoA lyase
MRSLETARSFLFAPGNDPRKLAKAFESDAHAVVCDLEDAVAEADKAAARSVTVEALTEATGGALRLARVNAAGSPWIDDDVAALATVGVDAVVLPKATPAAVDAVSPLGVPVIAIAETAAGVRQAYELATSPSVAVLLLGAVDLSLDLGLEPRDDGLEILFARSSVVVDSTAAGLRGPIDRVWTALDDEHGLVEDCAFGRSLGFRGKACIHPKQVAAVNEAYSPSAAEVERARSLVAAYEAAASDGRGALRHEGEMIDLPVVERARQLLAETNEEGAG